MFRLLQYSTNIQFYPKFISYSQHRYSKYLKLYNIILDGLICYDQFLHLAQAFMLIHISIAYILNLKQMIGNY